MSNVITIKGDLFDAPSGVIIAHACNCKGVWGSGIAAQFAKRYPDARNTYSQECQEKGHTLLGTSMLIPAGDKVIGCLFTSKSFGQNVDKVQDILDATRTAIADLIAKNVENRPIHMCKINSGLFGVNWRSTKKILKEFENVTFVVYDY